MTNNQYIEKLYLRKKELIRIANYHGIFGYDCDDILQDLYIKLLLLKDIDRYTVNNQPNIYIVFMIIKNLIYDFRKREKKFEANETLEFAYIPENINENEKYDFILNQIENIPYWFDKNIIQIYITENHTIRSLSKDTHIPFSTIQPIVHKFKEKCKEEYIKNQKL